MKVKILEESVVLRLRALLSLEDEGLGQLIGGARHLAKEKWKLGKRCPLMVQSAV